MSRPTGGASPDRPTKTWKLLLVGVAGGVVLSVWVVLSADPAHPEAVGRREMAIFGIFVVGLRILFWIDRWHRWLGKEEANPAYPIQEETLGGDSQGLGPRKPASRRRVGQLAHDWLEGRLAYSDFSHAACTIPDLLDDEDVSELMYLIDHASAGVQLSTNGGSADAAERTPVLQAPTREPAQEHLWLLVRPFCWVLGWRERARAKHQQAIAKERQEISKLIERILAVR